MSADEFEAFVNACWPIGILPAGFAVMVVMLIVMDRYNRGRRYCAPISWLEPLRIDGIDMIPILLVTAFCAFLWPVVFGVLAPALLVFFLLLFAAKYVAVFISRAIPRVGRLWRMSEEKET